MKKVITYGTFDLLHVGHINLLRRARELGNHLTVAVSTDEFNALKGKKTILPFAERMEIVKSLRYVDVVIPETAWEQKTGDIQKHQINTFVMGDDWNGKFDFLAPYCEVVYLERTPHISSSQLKTELSRLQTAQALIEKLGQGDIKDLISILDKIVNLK
ncbi:MAG: glycerol-3-phosphate cytidylyltransferase [Kiritimatiellia bacterium]|jgi:glycerol-3-phosphate cytidylyltransferase|nr:glycerol-3-phosphate cytidylyltransferase [Kiritimatiellia bacterium]